MRIEIKKCYVITLFFLLAVLLLFASPSNAVHKGAGEMVCSDCHVLDGNGNATLELVTTDVNTLCFSCHASGGMWASIFSAPAGVIPPKVYLSQYLNTWQEGENFSGIGAGGDFSGTGVWDGAQFILNNKDDCNNQSVGKGHSLGCSQVPPGADSSIPFKLTCITCHDPHGTADDNDPNVNRFRYLRKQPLGGGGGTNLDQDGPVTIKADSYVGGVTGLAAAAGGYGNYDGSNDGSGEHIWPVFLDPSQQNSYEAPPGMAAFMEGISAWCSQCHDKWHEGSFPENKSGSQDWNRHPVDTPLVGDGTPNSSAGTEITRFNNYNMIPAGMKLPAADTDNSKTYYANDSRDKVFCLSCHFAHGGPFNDALRWDYTEHGNDNNGDNYEIQPGFQVGKTSRSNVGCQQCHNGNSSTSAVHGGNCGQCHTMHNSQGKEPLIYQAENYSPAVTTDDPSMILLRAKVTGRHNVHNLCLQCHGEGGAQAGIVQNGSNVIAPKVFLSPQSRTWEMNGDPFNGAEFNTIGAGGDFSGSGEWTGGEFYLNPNDGGDGSNCDPARASLGKGHSIGCLNVVPPGADSEVGIDLSCTSCHDPHGTTLPPGADPLINRFRLLLSQPIGGGGGKSLDSDGPVYVFGESYVGSVTGVPGSANANYKGNMASWGAPPYDGSSAANHVWPLWVDNNNQNTYNAPLGSAADPSAGLNQNMRNQGISEWCAQCHDKWHEASREANESSESSNLDFSKAKDTGDCDGDGSMDTGIDWKRHPVDTPFTGDGSPCSTAGSEIVRYSHYTNIPPGYKLPAANTNGQMKDVYYANEPSDKVFCLSCHFVHGGPYNDALRWDYTEHSSDKNEIQPGSQVGKSSGSNVGCEQCHNRGNVGGGVHGGNCAQCHTLHNSQGRESLVYNSKMYDPPITSSDPSMILLRAKVTGREKMHNLCLQCHGMGGAQANVIQNGSNVTAPKVYLDPSSQNWANNWDPVNGEEFNSIGAGGDFSGAGTWTGAEFVLNQKDGGDGSSSDCDSTGVSLGKGHSIGCSGVVPPGADSEVGIDMSCTSCHDPHGTALPPDVDPYINRFRYLRYQPIGGGGGQQFDSDGPVRVFGESYVGAVTGLPSFGGNSKGNMTEGNRYAEGDSSGNHIWPVWIDWSNQNTYNAPPGPASDPYNPGGGGMTREGISAWCAQCHDKWHEASREANQDSNRSNLAFNDIQFTGDCDGWGPWEDTGIDWRRHPVDTPLKGDGSPCSTNGVEIVRYTHYLYDIESGLQLPAANTSGYPNDGYSANQDTDKVFCLSCHFVHGGPFNDSLRWDYTAHSADNNGDNNDILPGKQVAKEVNRRVGCQQCHNSTVPANPWENFTLPEHHQEAQGLKCATCHTMHNSQGRETLIYDASTYSPPITASDPIALLLRSPIQDTTPPIIAPPEDITEELTNPNGVSLSWGLGWPAVSDDTDPYWSLVVTNDAPVFFQLGETLVTWTATDLSDNSASAIQKVTLVDTTPPVIVPPEDIQIIVSGAEGTSVNLGTPVVTDTIDPSPTVTNNAQSLFPKGKTVVTWEAQDASGNVGFGNQLVNVVCASGDLDCDGVVDGTDYRLFRSTLGKYEGDAGYIPEADYDGDKRITYADYRIWYGYFRGL